MSQRSRRSNTRMATVAAELIFILAIIVMCVFFVAAVTVIPMSENYRECGSIFLCGPSQHRARPQ